MLVNRTAAAATIPAAVSPAAASRGARDIQRSMEFDGVIFDLDGTLVDTLEDIADAMDRVLALEGAPGHTLRGVPLPHRARHPEPGDGVAAGGAAQRGAHRAVLRAHARGLRRTLPGQDARVRRASPSWYARCEPDGVPLAIHSNKADAPTQAIVAALLDPGDFVQVSGARQDAPLKPDPAVALAIAARFGLPPARVAYVGDSLVDMRTATAAGMIAVGAAWGFRTPRELVESGAAVVIDAPPDLLGLRG